MALIDQTRGECLVLTFKEGLLSPIAHDLKIRVGAFRIEIGGSQPRIDATFDASSLRVVSAMKDGVDSPGTLTAADIRKIEDSIVTDVLHTKRHPEVRFRSRSVTSSGGTHDIQGELTLHGRTRPLRFTARQVSDRWLAEIALHQPDFGIKPFKAMLGTLKVQPTVRVRVSIPVEA